jgi:hypothetical protein
MENLVAQVSDCRLFLSFPFAVKLIYVLENFRTKSLSHIRQIYIPELIIRLHTLLMSTGSKISRCVGNLFEMQRHA